MKLFLVRNGRAEKSSSWSGSDMDRPLVPGEAERAHSLGDSLSAQGYTFRHVICGSALRSTQTAACLAQSLAFDGEVDVSDAFDTKAGTERSVQYLHGVPCDHRNVLVVSQQRVIDHLVSYLTTGQLFAYIDLPRLGGVVLDVPAFSAGRCAYWYWMWRSETLTGDAPSEA